MTTTQDAKPSFEEALEQLEGLVARMEEGGIPLATLIDHYQRGNELLAACSARLHEAGQKIEMLKKDRKVVAFEDFDPDRV